jgi:hypothetical protein
MSNEIELRNAGDGPPVARALPWQLALGGLIAVAIAAVVNLAVDGMRPRTDALSSQAGFAAIVRLILTVGGIAAAGIAVWLRPSSVGILSSACVTGMLARLGFHPAWDSGMLLAGLGSIAAGTAAVLMALPQRYRRVGVSVLVVLHFIGILTCVTGPPTHGRPAPWLSQAASTYVYRPYLQSIYLVNAYHFYSPEPGPAGQIWFCIHYQRKDAKPGEDPRGDGRWYMLPRRPKDMTDPLALSYYRRLSLTQQLESYRPVPAMPQEILRRRDVRSYGEDGIRWHPEIPREGQYRPPAEQIQSFLLPSYVRHVAELPEVRHPDGLPIYSIKVYRVEHQILMPHQLKFAGFYDPQTFLPFFQGEYDAKGNQINPEDPMLHWLVPIFWEPKSADVQPWENPKDNPNKFKLHDGVLLHTGIPR